jgi:uncharacterized membrane protein
MNSGDWVENLTSLEYAEKQWKIYKYQDDDFANKVKVYASKKDEQLKSKELFARLVNEFTKMKQG